MLTERQAAELATAALAEFVIGPAADRAALDASLRENAKAFAFLKEVAPELWEQLRQQTFAARDGFDKATSRI